MEREINNCLTFQATTEMGDYIMSIIMANQLLPMSWGAYNFKEIDNGLMFHVDGFKFHGDVEVSYDEGSDTFNVVFFNQTVTKRYTDVYFDELAELIDTYVEYDPENYESNVKGEFVSVI